MPVADTAASRRSKEGVFIRNRLAPNFRDAVKPNFAKNQKNLPNFAGSLSVRLPRGFAARCIVCFRRSETGRVFRAPAARRAQWEGRSVAATFSRQSVRPPRLAI